MGLWRVVVAGEERVARGAPTAGPSELLPAHVQFDSLLSAGGSLLSAMSEPADGPVPEAARIGAPIGTQEVWAAGVTYLRSRDARMEESESPDFYALVYEADRPELFFKSGASRVRGPQEPIGIRADSTWDVPEPELCVIANADGRIVGYTIGNDVSSRSIEGGEPVVPAPGQDLHRQLRAGPVPRARRARRLGRRDGDRDHDPARWRDHLPRSRLHRAAQAHPSGAG